MYMDFCYSVNLMSGRGTQSTTESQTLCCIVIQWGPVAPFAIATGKFMTQCSGWLAAVAAGLSLQPLHDHSVHNTRLLPDDGISRPVVLLR